MALDPCYAKWSPTSPWYFRVSPCSQSWLHSHLGGKWFMRIRKMWRRRFSGFTSSSSEWQHTTTSNLVSGLRSILATCFIFCKVRFSGHSISQNRSNTRYFCLPYGGLSALLISKSRRPRRRSKMTCLQTASNCKCILRSRVEFTNFDCNSLISYGLLARSSLQACLWAPW